MELLKARPDLINLIKSVAIEQGLGHYKITNVTTNEKGAGYGSQIFLVSLVDSTKNKKLDLVIKTAFIDDTFRSDAVIKAFENESRFYCTTYPAFKKFESGKKVSEMIEHIPRCYRVSLRDREEVICLENLKPQGFEVFNKKLPLDHDHVSLLFKRYGRLHAYSFALQDQQPKEYNKLIKGQCNILIDVLEDEKTRYVENMAGFLDAARKCLASGEDDDVIKKFEKYNSQGFATLFRDALTKPDDFSVILHGDCWSNNLMFKYEETENGRKPCDLRLLDLQLVIVGSPVNDLSYCLYSGGSNKEVYDNLDTYLKMYYDSLSSFLKELGSDSEKLFPFDALQEHWKTYSKFGMMMGIMVQKVKLTEIDEMKEYSDSAEVGQDLVTSTFDEETFQTRMRDLLRHMSQIDAL